MSEQKLHQIDGVTYREVDRKAEVGDKVIGVLCEYYSEKYDGYSIGKVYEVTGIKESGSDVRYYVNDKFKGGDPLWLVSEKYRVLEPVEVEAGHPDMVESPPHYNAGRFEVIDIIAEVTKGYEDPFVGYNVGNTQKYIARAPYKGKLVEDLRKAKRYLEYAIDHIEAKENGVK